VFQKITWLLARHAIASAGWDERQPWHGVGAGALHAFPGLNESALRGWTLHVSKASSKGTLTSGDLYTNEYVFLLKMRDAGEGKIEITEMKEFVDTVASQRLAQIVKKIRDASGQ
jgi:hypothetical protein